MIYTLCPTCGGLQHLNLALEVDLQDWYDKFAPELKPGELPSIECFGCSRSLSVGHRVRRIIRASNEKPTLGEEGIITAVGQSEVTDYMVEFEDSTENGGFTRNELYSSGEISEQFKDQCDLLCDATEDWYSIDEAKTILQDLSRARLAIGVLFKKDYIRLWWYSCWASSEPPKELKAKDSRNAMYTLKQEDKWWDAGEYMRTGYYAYSATEKGRQHFLKNPAVRFYMQTEWHRMAYDRGQISEDLYKKIERRCQR